MQKGKKPAVMSQIFKVAHLQEGAKMQPIVLSFERGLFGLMLFTLSRNNFKKYSSKELKNLASEGGGPFRQ